MYSYLFLKEFRVSSSILWGMPRREEEYWCESYFPTWSIHLFLQLRFRFRFRFRIQISWFSIRPFKTHFFPLKHSWAYFLFVRKISWSVFRSKMERKKWKPALKMFSSGSTLRTPFCKHLLRLGPTPPSTYINIKQLHDVVEKPNLVWETGEKLFNSHLMRI